ncbi:MAG: hypothetical protein KDC44_14125, partial [Phaeodactylibacter sp.]|nr:hypothetical protein [Phaeodactylibacter sp.]
MPTVDVTLLTDHRYVDPKELTPYVRNILQEDGLVLQALQAFGLKVERKDWADPNYDWSQTRTALFRTTWDYFHRFAAFSDWLDHVESRTTLINPITQIRWNMDKRYLLELEAKGVPIVQTQLLEAGTKTNLQALHEDLGWQDTVLKPAVSGGGRHTYRLHPGNYQAHENVFQQLLAEEALLLQPFQRNIVEKGELSLILIDGQYSHAVLKVAKPGDFRVQDDFGGSVHVYTPTAEEIQFAEAAIAACDPQPLYARVDMATDNEDRLAIVELE